MELKAFFHGRGRHSKGWDGYVMVGEVTDESVDFDLYTYTGTETIKNFSVSLKQIPTTEDLEVLLQSKIDIYQNELDNPVVVVLDRDSTIQRFIDEGILPTDTEIQTADQLPNEMQDAIIAMIKGGM